MVAFVNEFVVAVDDDKFAFVVDDEVVFFAIDDLEALSVGGDKG